MFSFLSRFIFSRKVPKILIFTENSPRFFETEIRYIFGKFLKVTEYHFSPFDLRKVLRNNFLIFNLAKESQFHKLKFLARKSSFPIFVVLKKNKMLENFLLSLPSYPKSSLFIFNADDGLVLPTRKLPSVRYLTFGFSEGTNFQATDYHLDHRGINFKLNFQGNLLPIWLENLFGRSYIYGALSALAVGAGLNLNLIKISQILRSWEGINGIGQIKRGKNQILILDNSQNQSNTLALESIKVLSNTDLGLFGGKSQYRRIAIVGDILDREKISRDHGILAQGITEKINLLFIIGQQSDFLAKKFESSLKKEFIKQFHDVDSAILYLKQILRAGDVVLVDGSREVKMGEIVEALEKD